MKQMWQICLHRPTSDQWTAQPGVTSQVISVSKRACSHFPVVLQIYYISIFVCLHICIFSCFHSADFYNICSCFHTKYFFRFKKQYFRHLPKYCSGAAYLVTPTLITRLLKVFVLYLFCFCICLVFVLYLSCIYLLFAFKFVFVRVFV